MGFLSQPPTSGSTSNLCSVSTIVDNKKDMISLCMYHTRAASRSRNKIESALVMINGGERSLEHKRPYITQLPGVERSACTIICRRESAPTV